MADRLPAGASPAADNQSPIVVVSSDTHIGPRLVDDLRPYCPASYLSRFDEFAAQMDQAREELYQKIGGRKTEGFRRNHQTAGHYDMEARLRDLDREGVAAEVIFHGSQNEEAIPWGTFVAFYGPSTDDLDLVAEGRSIFNRWLADAVSVQPERHVGLAHLPMWDIDAAVYEVSMAADAGLRGVNFPAPRPELLPYNDPAWDPFWAVCAERGLPLTTHSGAGNPKEWTGKEAGVLMALESGGWFSRRALHQMIFGGVFERHPDLTLVLTEQPGDWWAYTLREMDSAYISQRGLLSSHVPRLPSEYCRENVAIGASFLAHFEALDAVEAGYAEQVMWGSDYPHTEGTYQFQADESEPPMGRLAMRHTFAGIDGNSVRAMVGENAMRVYGLDRDRLQAVADRIGAPSLDELGTPIEEIPSDGGRLSFRTFGPWA
jgi:predicted TIM-barrel fold metal-dependent hydrolase